MNPGADPVAPFRTTWAKTSDFFRLTKPKLLSLVLFTTMAGFFAASGGPVSMLQLAHTLIGTALIAGGATTLNMYREREADARMKRTALRPLAAGRLPAGQALAFALVLSAAGLVYLFAGVHPTTGALAAIVFACYLCLYTPLKTRTWLSTFVGAISGALPVVMGWTAAGGALSCHAWMLFAIVFLWQLPHFYSIGWMHREEYAHAGFAVISVVDRDGRRTGRLAVLFVAVLLGITLLPFIHGLAGRTYLAGAVILGLLFLGCAVRFAVLRSFRTARTLFVASAFYLPVLLLLLVLDKTVTR